MALGWAAGAVAGGKPRWQARRGSAAGQPGVAVQADWALDGQQALPRLGSRTRQNGLHEKGDPAIGREQEAAARPAYAPFAVVEAKELHPERRAGPTPSLPPVKLLCPSVWRLASMIETLKARSHALCPSIGNVADHKKRGDSVASEFEAVAALRAPSNPPSKHIWHWAAVKAWRHSTAPRLPKPFAAIAAFRV